MKKILLALTLTLTSSIAFAGETFAINGGSAKSPTSALTQAYASSGLERSFKLVKGCEEAIKAGDRITDSVYLSTNDIMANGAKQGKSCYKNLEPEKIVFMVENSFQVCRLPSTTAKLTDPGVKIGRASVHPIPAFVNDFNANNNASIKGVALNGSKSVLAAVLNGDIEWGVIANDIAQPVAKQGKITCDYDTTVAGSPTGKSLNDSFKLSLDGYTLRYAFIMSNASLNGLEVAKLEAQSKQFRTYLANGGFYNFKLRPSKKDIEEYVSNAKALEAY